MNSDLEIKKKFQMVLDDLENSFENSIFYKKYVLETKVYKVDGKNFYILVKNDFVKESLKKYIDEVTNSIAKFFHGSYDVFFITEQEKNIIKYPKKESNINFINNNSLDSKMTFDCLVVGPFNEHASKAFHMLLDDTSKWSLIFIYGNTGLGKTHLLNAFGNKFLQLYPSKNVQYIHIDDFFKKAYNAISSGSNEVEKFKESFNDVDVLLVDDIQFLSNKDKMNEIFFNIFNKLQKNNKIVILSSDKLPSSLKLEDRMISRFNSGLNLKINSPDIESIKKIIITKLDKYDRNALFTSNAINYLANKCNTDIRTLEGIINKILFFSQNEINQKIVLNEDDIKNILEDDQDLKNLVTNISVNPMLIIESVCLAYNVDAKHVISKKRNKDFSFVRKVCMYVLREKLNLSYNEIGSLFSNRNHSTVLESIKNVENLIKDDENLKVFVENIIKNC